MDKVVFKDIQAEHINRYRLIPVTGSESVYDITPERGVVSQEGTPVRAKELNDMQNNIDACKAEKEDSIPLHTFTPDPDPLDPGDWIVTPTIGNLDKPPTAGMMIRAIFSAEWNAPSNLRFGGSMTIIGPAGTYPAGTYLLTLNITGGVMSWQIQGAEPIGPTADALEAKANRQDAASVITGTATGEVAHLPDAAIGTRLRSMTISGRTAETGTGEIGPQNPYTLSGVQPGQLMVTGINLINPVWVAGGVELQEDNRYYFDTSRSSRVYNMPCKLPAGTYTLSFRYQREQAIETAGVRLIGDDSTFTYIGRGNDTEEHQLSYSFRIKAPTVIGIGVYTDEAALNVPRTPVWLSDVMLCVGAKAQPYTPYSGEVYSFPATSPLYSLPDGTADTYSNTGEQVIRIGSMALVPDMMWEVSVRTNTTRFVSSVQTDILRESAYNAVLCNYLPTNEVYDDDVAGICLHEGRVVLSLPGSWDTTALYDWLAVPPGGAVTVYYPLAVPTTTQLDGITVTVPALDTYISAQGATVTAEYNKDTTAVIAALTARIAALEGGGGA